MEFDTKIGLHKVLTFTVVSSMGKEDFLKSVHDVLISEAKEVGDDADGAFWMDYSNTLATRHLLCDVTLPDGESENGQTAYNITFSAGKRFSYLLDVVIGFLALAIVWGFSKVMVPEPQTFPYVVIFASCGVLGLLLSSFGKAFGVKESQKAADAIRSSLDGK